MTATREPTIKELERPAELAQERTLRNFSREIWLACLWEHGETITAIGHAMGISRNAVIGKARRMGLAPRGSPIKARLLPRRRPCLVCGAAIDCVESHIKTCGRVECLTVITKKRRRSRLDRELMKELRRQWAGKPIAAREPAGDCEAHAPGHSTTH